MRIGNSIRQKRKGYRVVIIGILLFLQCIIISVDADPSQGRWGHASVLINNRLYVYGGRTDQSSSAGSDTSNNINELIYLDVSKPFDLATPPWVVKTSSLPSGVESPFLSFHSCSLGGNQNELLILFGGKSRGQIDNSLFTYNTTTETWLNSPAASIQGRAKHTIVTKLSDSIAYLWGGTPVGDGENVRAINDLYKLTTRGTISWELLSATASPAGRWDHSATLLNDGKMYIVGGVLSSENGGIVLAPMTEIPVYDTNAGTWTSQTAAGTIPPQRRAHGAVGTADIIIYGGTTAALDQKFIDIAKLNVAGGVLIWEIPPVKGTIPPGRYAHSMILAGSKAIVTFGFVDDFTGTKLFVLDTDSFTWDLNYNPSGLDSTPINTTPTNTNNITNATGKNVSNTENKNSGVIIGVSVCGGVLVLVLGGLLFYCIRRRNKQLSFSATPYEKHQASIPPIAGPAPPLHSLNNYSPSSPSQGGAGGTTNNAPFIPPFATSSYQRRQSSFGSISETRNLAPVEQHDSWGSAPSNSSQSQLPQINPNIPYYETNNYYKPTTPTITSPYVITTPNVPYLSPSTPPPQIHYSNTPPTPPPSTPTPPPVSPQRDLFPTNDTAGASSSTKTSSSNLRLDSDSNTAPAEFDFNLPPVAPLSINRARSSSPSQAQAQAQQHLPPPPRLTTSSSSLPQDSSNDLVSSPTEIEATETSSTTENGGLGGLFNSPLFRTEALSALAGTAAATSPTDRTLSLRSVPRINTSTPRNSTGLSSPSPIPAGGGLRSGTLDGRRIYSNEDGITGGSGPTSPIDNDSSDNQPPRGRLFVANPDPSDESD